MKHSEHQNSESLPQAKISVSKTILSSIWLIPLFAAVIGIYLLVQNFSQRGLEVTLLMDNADGLSVKNTTIRVLNVEVGRVSAIRLNPARNGVEITAQLNRESMDLMRKDTQFWVVKPRIDRNGVTGLSTLLSGSYISFAPGVSEEREQVFHVANLPPISALGESGIRLNLKGKNNRMIAEGSPVLFENHIVGMVETAKFDPIEKNVHYSVFIQSPNESLINGASRFWLDNGIDISLNGNGVNIQTPPISALISGAIVFDSPMYRPESKQKITNGAQFNIYNNRAEVENLPHKRTLYYVVFFKESIQGLSVGAPVMYKGIRIGHVADVPYFAPNDQIHLFQNAYIPVRIRIEPFLIEGVNVDNRPDKETWQHTLQAAFNQGLTASLSPNNLLLGSKLIEFHDKPVGATFKPHAQYHGDTVIASSGGGGFEQLQIQLSQLLDKINHLPLEKTVAGLNQNLAEIQNTLKMTQNMMASAQRLLNSPDAQNMASELRKTLQELRQTLQHISPESPVYQDVQNTLKSIDKTLRDVQPIIHTIQDKPNSLIFNRNINDPTPKGMP